MDHGLAVCNYDYPGLDQFDGPEDIFSRLAELTAGDDAEWYLTIDGVGRGVSRVRIEHVRTGVAFEQCGTYTLWCVATCVLWAERDA